MIRASTRSGLGVHHVPLVALRLARHDPLAVHLGQLAKSRNHDTALLSRVHGQLPFVTYSIDYGRLTRLPQRIYFGRFFSGGDMAAKQSIGPPRGGLGAVEIVMLGCRCRCGHEWIT